MMNANGFLQDGQGNGAVNVDSVPVTPVAFQTKFNAGTCGYYQNGSFGTPQPIPCQHGFAVKISADGSTILYATYLEGSQNDFAIPVGVDSSGDLFVLVNSTSPDFPSTGSIKGLPLNGFGANYFILELSSDGSSLLFSDEFGFPGDPGVRTRQCNSADVRREFVFEWDPQTNTIIHSTLIGGSNQDLLTSLTMDASGNFYVAGYTISTDFPLTPGAFYSPSTDPLQAVNDFVAKLDANLSTLDFSLLFGGSYHPMPNAVAVDSSGNVYVDGWGSEDLPVSPGAFETSYSGRFLAKFNGKNGARIYFTYLGDGDSGFPGTLAPAADGTIWVADGYLKHISGDGSQQLYGTYLEGLLDLVSPGIALVSGSTNLFQIDDLNIPSQPPTGPLITSIVNAASFGQPDYISPGEIVTIFGPSIGPKQPVSYQLNSGGDVSSNPKWASSADQRGRRADSLRVRESDQRSGAVRRHEHGGKSGHCYSRGAKPVARSRVDSVSIDSFLCAIDSFLCATDFRVWRNWPILNQDATENTPANPAKQGSIISLFVTGLGPMTPAPMDGSFATATHSTPALPIQVFLGTGSVNSYTPVNQNSITYAGDAPGEIEGLQQINVQLPTGALSSSLSACVESPKGPLAHARGSVDSLRYRAATVRESVSTQAAIHYGRLMSLGGDSFRFPRLAALFPLGARGADAGAGAVH